MISPATGAVTQLRFGNLRIEVYPNREASGAAAADAAAAEMIALGNRFPSFSVLFATGLSQLEILNALILVPDVPWRKISGFHLDDYIGVHDTHLASPRRFIREKLTQRVPLKHFAEIDGTAPDSEQVARDYARALREQPPQLCLLGIGENGHLAFNDPAEGVFGEVPDVRTVLLSEDTIDQLAAEGRFKSRAEVATRAITVSIPAILRIPKLIVSVPGQRKAHVIRRTVQDPISTTCPSTILRTHPDTTIYIDAAAAAEIDEITMQ